MDNLKNLPIVYIDETRIDRYLYSPYARAPRGEKVYEKINGRRFERTSIVAGQVDGDFIAPMIYKDSMTIDFFVEWFKTQLRYEFENNLIASASAEFVSRIGATSFNENSDNNLPNF